MAEEPIEQRGGPIGLAGEGEVVDQSEAPPGAERPGYEPYDDVDGIIRLRSCPFDRIGSPSHHHDLICCATSHAPSPDRLEGDRLVRAVLDPQPGRCCVALRRHS